MLLLYYFHTDFLYYYFFKKNLADTPFEDGTFKLVLQFDETYVSN